MSTEVMDDDPNTKKEGEANNDPSEAMNTPADVEESNDENINKDFPGYPHYPANEDILDPEKNNGKVDVDVANLSSQGKNVHTDLRNEILKPAGDTVNAPFDEEIDNDDIDDIGIVPGTDADVTAEDLLLLGAKDRDMDMGEDEDNPLANSLFDKAGYKLDTPGAEIDDANESIGEEDEENNYYSLGGDRHENLEEDSSNTF